MWTVWIACSLILLVLGYFSPYVLRGIQQRRLRFLCQRDRALVLTYDDGPGRVMTPRLLELLSSEGAKATFYLVGKRVQESPDVVSLIANDGHELASHSQDHLNAWKVAPWRSLSDVERGFATLNQTGVSFRLFRPPYGKINFLTWWAAIRQRVQVGWWTIVSGDTFSILPDPSSVVDQVELNHGGVVLMHDFDRDEVDRSNYVLDLTRRLIEVARKNGWKICTQSELLQSGRLGNR